MVSAGQSVHQRSLFNILANINNLRVSLSNTIWLNFATGIGKCSDVYTCQQSFPTFWKRVDAQGIMLVVLRKRCDGNRL